MLFAVLYSKSVSASDAAAWEQWQRHELLREELAALVPVLRERNAALVDAHSIQDDVPLTLHSRYLGVELSAAFDHRTADSGEFREYYTGVEAVGAGRFDLLLVTLSKKKKTKEHLRYRDFPLNERRFHWQSKAGTTRDDEHGRRHLRPAEAGCTPLLFVREKDKTQTGATMAFCYLGPVDPDGDEGERPITVEWRLQYPMPRELLNVGRVAS
jgi:hypothetical protein